MAGVTPDTWLPSQPQTATAPWTAPNNTAWRQRHGIWLWRICL